MSRNLLLMSLLAGLFIIASASAATVTWVGTTSDDWNTATNWDVGYLPGGVSGQTDTATIPAVVSPAVFPVLSGTEPSGGGTIQTTTISSGASLTVNGTLNSTQLTINASGSVGGNLTVNQGATINFQGTSSLSHYWNAGTATIRGTATENRNLYFASGGTSGAPRTMTVNLLDGGVLNTGNQCVFTLGNGTYSTGIFNIWGNNAGVGSLWSNGNSGPRLNYNGGSSYISLKDGGRIEYPTGQDSTFQTAINNNVIRSGDARQIIVKALVPGSTTRYRITTQTMDKAYNPNPASAGSNPTTMTLVTLGSLPVSWTSPLARDYSDTVEMKVYANFATASYPVDVNGYPTDPNGDLLPLYTTITRPATSFINITTVVGGMYQWRIDCVDHSKDGIDPNYPITTKGDVWYFRTGNSAPVANAGTSPVVLGLVGGAATFDSDATITDDGLPIGGSVTGQWTQLDGPAVVAGLPANITASSPNVSLNLTVPGRYHFQLIPYDTALYGTASIVQVNLYSDSCVAAKAGTWTALQGDFNSDCKVSGSDLALMIVDWLRCTDAISGCN